MSIELDKTAILREFGGAYRALRNAAGLVIQGVRNKADEVAAAEDEDVVLDNDYDTIIKLADLMGQFRSINAQLNDLHHTIGHALFDKCWKRTEVGREFDPEDEIGKLVPIKLEDLPEEIRSEIDKALLDVDARMSREQNPQKFDN
jgi:hypothetical protein